MDAIRLPAAAAVLVSRAPRCVSYELHGHLAAPPAAVWAALRDVERWPRWTPTVTRAAWVHQATLVTGARVRLHQPGLLPATWTVEQAEPFRGFSWSCQGLGVSVQAGHWIEPAADGCQLCLTITLRGPCAAAAALLFGRLNQRYLQRELAGLAEYLGRCHPPVSMNGDATP
ncbi:SRPBCC family protein [Zemynaea arenosa]|uniref:SRPBCC family protein n=1 Tax=Zemynaea arenosa TaxID=2561931 RepID=UPI00142F3E3F|nr:SRPBCC family protein [Massilia arenosa]